MSGKPENIYTALCAAQAEFGKVQKGSVNPAFKSRYADLADVASVVIPALSAHGVAVLHYIVQRGDGMDMRTEFVHAATETRVHCDIPLIVDRNNMQGMKSATTYAKRIGLESLSGVAPEDDDGNAAAKAPPPKREAKPAPEPAKPAARDPAEIADGIIKAINARETVTALNELLADGTKAAQAWEWLEIEAPEHAKRVAVARDERTAALTDAPF